MGTLSNKRNTRIEDNHCGAALYHHGHNTVSLDKVNREVKISLCGYDTVTTRRKINAFLQSQGIRTISVQRVRGFTVLTYYKDGDGSMVAMLPRGYYVASF